MENELCHHGVKGQKWGVRRFQNEDGSLTPAGEKRYGKPIDSQTYAIAYRYVNKGLKTVTENTNDETVDDLINSIYANLERIELDIPRDVVKGMIERTLAEKKVVEHSMDNELYHYGVLGQKWGVRRYQNEDGTLTEAGKEHYQKSASKVTRKFEKADKNKVKAAKANEQKYKYYSRMNPVIQQLLPHFSLNYRLARYQEAKERKNVSNEHQNQKRGKELLDQLIDEYGKDYVSSMNPEIIKLGEKALVTYVSYYNATLGDNWKSLDKIKLIGGGK